MNSSTIKHFKSILKNKDGDYMKFVNSFVNEGYGKRELDNFLSQANLAQAEMLGINEAWNLKFPKTQILVRKPTTGRYVSEDDAKIQRGLVQTFIQLMDGKEVSTSDVYKFSKQNEVNTSTMLSWIKKYSNLQVIPLRKRLGINWDWILENYNGPQDIQKCAEKFGITESQLKNAMNNYNKRNVGHEFKTTVKSMFSDLVEDKIKSVIELKKLGHSNVYIVNSIDGVSMYNVDKILELDSSWKQDYEVNKRKTQLHERWINLSTKLDIKPEPEVNETEVTEPEVIEPEVTESEVTEPKVDSFMDKIDQKIKFMKDEILRLVLNDGDLSVVNELKIKIKTLEELKA